MKSISYKNFLALAISFILMTYAHIASAAIQWQSYSDSAFAAAKSQKKLVLVYVGSYACHWCVKMTEETFSSPSITTLVNKKFIPVSVEMMSEQSLANSYGVRGTPTFIILDSNKHEVSRLVGYQTTSEFKSYLSGF